jgi:hypothetical protein
MSQKLNTGSFPLKNGSAELWCEKMSTTKHGQWRYLFAQQLKLEKALSKGTATFAKLASDLVASAQALVFQITGR